MVATGLGQRAEWGQKVGRSTPNRVQTEIVLGIGLCVVWTKCCSTYWQIPGTGCAICFGKVPLEERALGQQVGRAWRIERETTREARLAARTVDLPQHTSNRVRKSQRSSTFVLCFLDQSQTHAPSPTAACHRHLLAAPQGRTNFSTTNCFCYLIKDRTPTSFSERFRQELSIFLLHLASDGDTVNTLGAGSFPCLL